MNLLEMLSGLIQGFESAEPGVSGSNASVAVPAPQTYHLVLQAVGRTSNGKKIAADKSRRHRHRPCLHPCRHPMGADAVDIGKTIHPHPTLGESTGMAAEIAHGSCTDVPPARK